MNSLGIDVGGANLKVAGEGKMDIIYFPMWKMAEKLKEKLYEISRDYGAEKAGVVMTAELADVFRNKIEGIKFIAKKCMEVFKEVYFLDVHGNITKEIIDPREFSASNWIASISFLLSEGYKNFLFVDIGSTTVDLIPVREKILSALTDFERLKRRELIYFGILRTPVFYVLKSFEKARLCPEYFAIMADIFRIVGDIEEEDYNCETPDGKGKSVEDCMRRVARTVCCDLEELSEDKVKKLAFEAKKSMIKTLSREISNKINKYELKTVLACGIGEFLLEESFYCLRLSKIYGKASKLFPAFAMFKLVEKL
ncbi:MAG: hydantoinase/oxoprolinase family protein [Archaeoglobaceae archaeon]|nr:H4MPT-linked C1 transfer pathway protein [Archaeoglobaceae archaeon]MDW7989183.1 hydantoinase/oxoprolinase family protein [Archaeoglobaceae archaeon]